MANTENQPKTSAKRRSKAGKENGKSDGVRPSSRPSNRSSRPDEVAGLRRDLDEQRRDLNLLADQVEAVLRGEDRIQAQLYDLSLLLASVVQARSGPSGSEYHETDTGAEEEEESDGGAAPEDPAYATCIRRIREAVRRSLPRDAVVIVVSKGDEEMLDLYGRQAWHFPRDDEGEYSWYYPPDGPSVIAHLETLRSQGGQYILFPEPAMWWLEKYRELSDHLHLHYPVVYRDEKACIIFALDKKYPAVDTRAWRSSLGELFAAFADETDRDPSILDWNTGLDLKERFPAQAVFEPPDEDDTLPYIDGSVDVVIFASEDEGAIAEARRVAGYAVVALKLPEDIDLEGAEDEDIDVEFSIERIGAPTTEAQLPTVSIVIPTYNGATHLEQCLLSLDETLPHPFRGEIIVVDDGSGAEMQEQLRRWADDRPHMKVVRNEENSGFVTSCNRGAEEAEGEVLVFLNDDTLPQVGWLQSLLRTFREYPEVGAVGGRLLYPDGRLQEAGNVVFSDGSAANFGRDDFAVEDPLYTHVREVDYCSAALLATPREFFWGIGGFDKRFEPGYYEDTDYCFEVRKHGRRVYYQPKSVVVHIEGGTGGTDLTAGAKRYQVINFEKFADKWKKELKEQPDPPARWDQGTWYALAIRGES